MWAWLKSNEPTYEEHHPGKADLYATAATTTSILIGVSGIIFSVLWAASRSFAKEAESTRRQVENGSLIPEIHIARGDANITVHAAELGRSGTEALLDRDAQESMLTQIYSHGLAQAKVSFFVSIIFGMFGSAVLLAGVGLAIMHAENDGNRYAAIVTQTSGAVIDLLAGVFFLQSNRTRRDMGRQGVMLREDSQFDRRLRAAGILSDNISDVPLRDQVRAQMALRLVDGQQDISESVADSSGRDRDTGDAMSDEEEPSREN
ncbi:TRADD-N-associated membrane domain-containing protein [Actinacidiphila bryophytorum]|nr:hypothetical protein [Actinacidiphila bryophytorum]MBN6541758.1 hypothetical protein [Actinacidiphila bryophytorum]